MGIIETLAGAAIMYLVMPTASQVDDIHGNTSFVDNWAIGFIYGILLGMISEVFYGHLLPGRGRPGHKVCNHLSTMSQFLDR